MKRILILIVMIGFVFGQTDDEVRVRQEKSFDFQAEAKNAAHKVLSKKVSGVDLTEGQLQELRERIVYYNNLTVELILGVQESEPVPEPVPEVNELEVLVNELVAGADKYFWKSPRTNSVQRVQLALVGDLSGVDYLIENYRTRIYSSQHEYVLQQLNKIKVVS